MEAKKQPGKGARGRKPKGGAAHAATTGTPGPGHPFTRYRLRNNTGAPLERARLTGSPGPVPGALGGSTDVWIPPVTPQTPLPVGGSADADGIGGWNHIRQLNLELFVAPTVIHYEGGNCISEASNDPKSTTTHPPPP